MARGRTTRENVSDRPERSGGFVPDAAQPYAWYICLR